MQRNSLVLLFSIFCSTLFAQGISSIDITLGSGMSYRSLTNVDNDMFLERLKKARDSYSSQKLNWDIGINVNMEISDKIYFKSGLRLSTYGYDIHEGSYLQWVSQQDGSGTFESTLISNEPVFSFNTSTSSSKEYWFIELPLMLRFEKSTNNISPYLEAGMSTQYYLNSKFTDKSGSNSISNFIKEDQVNSINLFGNISGGINYRIKNALQLFIQASVSHQINPLDNGPIGERLYDYGLEIGMRKLFSAPVEK